MTTPVPPRARRRRTGPRTADRALVLRRFPYGESSLVVHLLTPRHGRVAVLAKGAYRVHSGYFGVLDLFDTLRISWRPNPRTDLGLLVEAALLQRRRGITSSLAGYRASLSILELARLGAREGHEEAELFELVVDALDQLARPEADPGLVPVAFELHFLALSGLAPALDACAACGAASGEPRSPDARIPFSHARGGRLCPACAARARDEGLPVGTQPLHVLRVARSLLQTPLRLLPRVRLDPARITRVRDLVRRFLEYHLESRPRSWGPGPRRERRRGGRTTQPR